MTAYDEIPYVTYARPETHPSRMAALAILHGLTPALPSRCRVLEIACGDAGNLIPMAAQLPESEFVGFDLAETAIQQGLQAVASLRLTNISLHALDLRETPAEWGEFDYILAHGLYSWVPDDVREHLMQLLSRHLAPHGVAYVSYNTFPGGHLRLMVRDMLLHHVRELADPRQRLAAARELAEFLLKQQPAQDPSRAGLRHILERVVAHNDSLFYHDDLAPINHHVFFHEFTAHAGRHGLQFLSDAEYYISRYAAIPPSEHVLEREQLIDFCLNRQFRETLLCRMDLYVDRADRPERVQPLSASALVQPVSEQPDTVSTQPEEFVTHKGGTLKTSHPVMKSALVEMAQAWPRALSFPELLTAVRSRLQAELPQDGPALAELLFHGYATNIIELFAEAPALTTNPGPKPVASPYARLQAARSSTVTNLNHQSVELTPEGRKLLPLLDGTRDRKTLRQALHQSAGALDKEIAALAQAGVLLTTVVNT